MPFCQTLLRLHVSRRTFSPLLCYTRPDQRAFPRPIREAKLLQRAVMTMQEIQINMVSHIWFTILKDHFDSLWEKR